MARSGSSRVCALLLAALALTGGGVMVDAQRQACDRACLENMLDRYVEALVARQPARSSG